MLKIKIILYDDNKPVDSLDRTLPKFDNSSEGNLSEHLRYTAYELIYRNLIHEKIDSKYSFLLDQLEIEQITSEDTESVF